MTVAPKVQLKGPAVYVAVFTGGLIKVGQTKDIGSRMRFLRYAVRKQTGLVLSELWACSCAIAQLVTHEENLICCGMVAYRWRRAKGREWFSGPRDSIRDVGARVGVTLVQMPVKDWKGGAE